jgi:hypothetical protein
MSDFMPIEEQLQERKVEQYADKYNKKYAKHMKLMESSLISKIRPVTTYDYYALGRQLEQFEDYKMMVEADGNLAQLGTVPNIALDVISVMYGTSPISAIASVQPIAEQQGIIYFKNLVAQTTRGTVTAGHILQGAVQMEQDVAVGYAGDRLTELAVTTDNTNTTFNYTLTQYPVRPGTLTFTFGGSGSPQNYQAMDNASGVILGQNVYGTINYVQGTLSLTFSSVIAAGMTCSVTYATDFEAASDLPKVLFQFATKSIAARVFALKDTVGLEQSYALKRRFGIIAEDQIAQDLVSSINAEIMNTTVMQLYTSAVGNTNWSQTAPVGVSYFEHKQSIKDYLARAESVLLSNAGRGTINVMIAGRFAASILQTLPGFIKISDGSTIGPHIFGTLDGTVIVRVPNATALDPNTILCLYKGASPFEAAAIYAPLTVH